MQHARTSSHSSRWAVLPASQALHLLLAAPSYPDPGPPLLLSPSSLGWLCSAGVGDQEQQALHATWGQVAEGECEPIKGISRGAQPRVGSRMLPSSLGAAPPALALVKPVPPQAPGPRATQERSFPASQVSCSPFSIFPLPFSCTQALHGARAGRAGDRGRPRTPLPTSAPRGTAPGRPRANNNSK